MQQQQDFQLSDGSHVLDKELSRFVWDRNIGHAGNPSTECDSFKVFVWSNENFQFADPRPTGLTGEIKGLGSRFANNLTRIISVGVE
jgi:hypothetical protein